jgi:hypothetical protein
MEMTTGGRGIAVGSWDWRLKGNFDTMLIRSKGKKESSGGKRDGIFEPGCVGVVGCGGLVLFADVLVMIWRIWLSVRLWLALTMSATTPAM